MVQMADRFDMTVPPCDMRWLSYRRLSVDVYDADADAGPKRNGPVDY